MEYAFSEKLRTILFLKRHLIFQQILFFYAEELEIARKFVLANPILKSGTSIGANVKEAQNAESNADFIHKMKVAKGG